MTVKGQTGAWYATFADGRAVTYRPAGAASILTPNDMATVEVKSDDIEKINKDKNLKFKLYQGIENGNINPIQGFF